MPTDNCRTAQGRYAFFRWTVWISENTARRGQQRTSALSLKLSEISLVKKNINSTPVLLLDDVLSELDGNRQNYLLNSLSDTQTIITCTGLDEFVKNRFQVDKVFHVVKGQVEVIDE